MIARIGRLRIRRIQSPVRHHFSLRFCSYYGLPGRVVANNGILFSESALKGAHFIEPCAQRKIPLVFLQNITGFMVGKQYETAGIAKNGAKMVTAVACAQVPKFTVLIGGSFVQAITACVAELTIRALCLCTNSRISVLGGEQQRVCCRKLNANGVQERTGEQWSAEAEQAFGQPIIDTDEEQGHPYYASARLWTTALLIRRTPGIGLGLSAALNKPMKTRALACSECRAGHVRIRFICRG